MNIHHKKLGFIHIPFIIAVAVLFGIGAGITISNHDFDKENNELIDQNTDTEDSINATTGVELNSTVQLEVGEISEGNSTQKSNEATDVDSVKTTETISIQTKPQTEIQKSLGEIEATDQLSIQNVTSIIDETEATISWNTSIKSDSRLILHDGDTEKIYVSKFESSKNHSVHLDNLESSKEYPYEIIASEGGSEVNKFSSVKTDRVYNIELVSLIGSGSPVEECTTLAITDTQSKALKGAQVTISGANQTSSMRYYTDTENEITDADGEIEYCHKATELKLVVNSIGYTFKTKNSSMTSWEITKPE